MKKISDKAREVLKRLEGLRLIAYRCSGEKWTIGFGHTKNVGPGKIITVEQAEKLFNDDCTEIEHYVNMFVKVDLKPHEFDAVCLFTFNVGPTALKRSTLLRKLNSGEVSAVLTEFEKWVYSSNTVDPVLVKRRAYEKKLFATGEY